MQLVIKSNPCHSSGTGQFCSTGAGASGEGGGTDLELLSSGRFPTNLNPVYRDVRDPRFVAMKVEDSIAEGKNLLREDLGPQALKEIERVVTDDAFVLTKPMKAYFGTQAPLKDGKMAFPSARYLTPDKVRAERYAGEGKVYGVTLPKGSRAFVGKVQGYDEVVLMPGAEFRMKGGRLSVLSDGTEYSRKLIKLVDDLDAKIK